MANVLIHKGGCHLVAVILWLSSRGCHLPNFCWSSAPILPREPVLVGPVSWLPRILLFNAWMVHHPSAIRSLKKKVCQEIFYVNFFFTIRTYLRPWKTCLNCFEFCFQFRRYVFDCRESKILGLVNTDFMFLKSLHPWWICSHIKGYLPDCFFKSSQTPVQSFLFWLRGVMQIAEFIKI